jgi:hypothetical protein
MPTMEESLSVRDGLLRMRDEQLRKLVSLATDKREAQRILEQIHTLEKAIEREHRVDFDHRFSRHKSAVLAILAYLDEVGKPTQPNVIIEALIDGGWRRGDEKAETNLKQSIASFSTGLGLKTKQIKQINGLIGRGEWDNSRFEP